MKTCSICKTEKTLDSFNKNRAKSDGLNTICRECSQKKSREYYSINGDYHKKAVFARNKRVKNEIKAKLEELKSVGCSKCNEKDTCCLDYHHLNEKNDGIAIMVNSGKSWEAILEEISKCILVCANCHRKIHAGKLQI